MRGLEVLRMLNRGSVDQRKPRAHRAVPSQELSETSLQHGNVQRPLQAQPIRDHAFPLGIVVYEPPHPALLASQRCLNWHERALESTQQQTIPARLHRVSNNGGSTA